MAGLSSGRAPPYATGPDVLFVAYYASAELGCYRVLGWPMPERILDLFTEFRNRTNGLPTPAGSGLLGALTYFGLDAMGATEKKEMQEAIGNGTWRGRFTPEEILDYCEADVDGARSACCRSCCRTSICRERLLRGPLHGRRRRHGARRHPDRRRDAGAPAGRLDGHPGRLIACDRRLRRLRRPDLQGRTVGEAGGRAEASRGRGSKAASWI